MLSYLYNANKYTNLLSKEEIMFYQLAFQTTSNLPNLIWITQKRF